MGTPPLLLLLLLLLYYFSSVAENSCGSPYQAPTIRTSYSLFMFLFKTRPVDGVELKVFPCFVVFPYRKNFPRVYITVVAYQGYT